MGSHSDGWAQPPGIQQGVQASMAQPLPSLQHYMLGNVASQVWRLIDGVLAVFLEI